jgi:hypothetical protein
MLTKEWPFSLCGGFGYKPQDVQISSFSYWDFTGM